MKLYRSVYNYGGWRTEYGAETDHIEAAKFSCEKAYIDWLQYAKESAFSKYMWDNLIAGNSAWVECKEDNGKWMRCWQPKTKDLWKLGWKKSAWHKGDR